MNIFSRTPRWSSKDTSTTKHSHVASSTPDCRKAIHAQGATIDLSRFSLLGLLAVEFTPLFVHVESDFDAEIHRRQVDAGHADQPGPAR